MNLGETFVANTQSAVLVQPGKGPLHDPTKHAQATAVFSPSPGQQWLDAPTAQQPPMRLGVVGSVSLDFIGTAPRMTPLPPDGRDGIHQGQQLGDVVAVGAGQLPGQGDAVALDEEVVFAP